MNKPTPTFISTAPKTELHTHMGTDKLQNLVISNKYMVNLCLDLEDLARSRRFNRAESF